MIRFLGLFSLFALAGCYDPYENNCPDTKDGRISAIVWGRMEIEERLKSPASAQHPRGWHNAKVEFIKDCHFEVTSYVDSQNGFGAMVRTFYTIETIYDPKKQSVKVLSVEFH